MLGSSTFHIGQLKSRSDATLSVEMTTRQLIHLERAPSPSGGPSNSRAVDAVAEHFVESASGLRRSEHRDFNGGRLVLSLDYYQGAERCADVSYSDKRPDQPVTIFYKSHYAYEDRSDYMVRPVPLLWMYVGREPLHVALEHATSLGEGEAMKRPCDVFLFPSVRWNIIQQHVYYLDRETSVPLRIEAYPQDAVRSPETLRWEWNAEELRTVQRRPVVFKSIQQSVAKGKIEGTWTTTVESIEFDKTYPDTFFQPKELPGMTVYDSNTPEQPATRSVVPGAETSGVGPQFSGTRQVASPPSDHGFLLSGSVVLAGVFILLTALWLRRRAGRA